MITKIRKKILYVAFILSYLCFFSVIFAQDNDINRTKISILVGKGIKLKNQGKLEEALQVFEEAHKIDSSYALPLLVWAETLEEAGLYKEAYNILSSVDLAKTTNVEKSQYYLIKANLLLAEGKLSEAKDTLNLAYQLQPKNPRVALKLALIHEILGDRISSKAIYNTLEYVTNLNSRERAVAYILSIRFGYIFKILEHTTALVNWLKKYDSGDELMPWGFAIIKSEIPFILTTLPIGLSGVCGLVYCFFITFLLIILARHATNDKENSKDILFAIIVFMHVLVTYLLGSSDVLLCFYKNQFSVYDVELVPVRLLIAANVCSYFMMLVYALFSTLSLELRPKKQELYSIFLFCWWFCLLVLLIQSNKIGIFQWGWIIISAFACMFFVVGMPLGRYILIYVGKYTGWEFIRINSYFATNFNRGSQVLSFTDAKVLENEILDKLAQEKYEEVIKVGNYLLSRTNKASFPNSWLAVNRALLEIEDIPKGYKEIKNYLQVFAQSNYANAGKILLAYYKTLVGDFAESVKIISQCTPDYAIIGKISEDLALLFLSAGRCNILYNELVEANINLNKGLKLAINSLTKLYIIFELMTIELKLNRPNKILELYNNSKNFEISGLKSKSMDLLLRAFVCNANNNISEAINLLEQACDICKYNNKAKYWLGYLLCKEGKFAVAEKILETMVPDTFETNNLLEIITNKKLPVA